MSYLDIPRLHFTGTFTASPSTINNSTTNYYNPATGQSPPFIDLNWNPYGSHAFTISATVQSFVDTAGQLHTSGDRLIGSALESYAPQVPAKLVDLDTEQQFVTRLFGVNLQLMLSGGSTPSMQGLWDDAGTLGNLWERVPSLQAPNPINTPNSAFGGSFQSVLENLSWLGGESALLSQLQQAAGAGLSVRLNLYGYQDQNANPNFRTGFISGTIGPQLFDEPLHLPPRLLLPTGASSQLSYAPAKVDSQGTTVTIDLGNSIPDANLGGPPVSGLTLQAAIGSTTSPTILGAVEYESESFQQTAGVIQFSLGVQPALQPLMILLNGAPQLAEQANGLYIDMDGSSLYMNPQDTQVVSVWATKFGEPAQGTEVPLSLVPQPLPPGADYNQPATGVLNFPSSVMIGMNGSANIEFSAAASFPREAMPPGRQSIGGQLYFIGGDWAAGNVGPGPLSVKLFNSLAASATWVNVQPILYRFYYMYGFMASIVDLSNYDEVVANAPAIQQVLNAGFDDPAYMPVSREMSGDERQLILDWIAGGFARGDVAKADRTEALLAAPASPWSAA